MRAEPGFVVPRLSQPGPGRSPVSRSPPSSLRASRSSASRSRRSSTLSRALSSWPCRRPTSSVGSSRTGSSARRSCSRSSCRRCATPPWSGSSPRSRREASTSSRLSSTRPGSGWAMSSSPASWALGSAPRRRGALRRLDSRPPPGDRDPGSAWPGGAEGGNPVCALPRRRGRDRAVLRGCDPRLVARVAQARRRCWSLHTPVKLAARNADSEAYGKPCRAFPRLGPDRPGPARIRVRRGPAPPSRRRLTRRRRSTARSRHFTMGSARPASPLSCSSTGGCGRSVCAATR